MNVTTKGQLYPKDLSKTIQENIDDNIIHFSINGDSEAIERFMAYILKEYRRCEYLKKNRSGY